MFTKALLLLEKYRDKKFAIALSGGADSMALLYFCIENGFNVCVVNCNFKLRSIASDNDSDFVREYCKKNYIDFYYKEFDTSKSANRNKTSIEMEARNLRYRYFDFLYNSKTFDYLLTGHHQNDNTETIFFRMIKNSGFIGLKGIPEKRNFILRPFLSINKIEILEYVKRNKIPFVIDKSNFDNKYVRNKLRNDIIPKIYDINPQFDNAISFLALSANQINDLILDVYKNIFEEWEKFEFIKLDHLKEKKYISILLYYLLYKDIINLSIIGNIANALESNESKIFHLNSFTISVKNWSIEKLNIYSIHEEILSLEELVNNSLLKCELVLNEEIMDANFLYINFNLLKFPLIISNNFTSKKISPLGMNGKSKLINDILNEKKITLNQKNRTIYIESNNEVVGIVPFCVSERYKVTNNCKILKISRIL